MPDNIEPLAINSTELRARLGISRSTLAKLIKEDKVLIPLPYLKRNRLFSYESILEFLRGQKKGNFENKEQKKNQP